MKTDVYNFWSVVAGGIALLINAATLLYVRWYALLTQTLVRSAQAQGTSTQKELDLLAAQVKAAQDSIELREKEARQAARPFFIWGNAGMGGLGGKTYILKYINKGGPITILETRSSNCRFVLSPQNFIPRDHEGSFQTWGFDPTLTRYVAIKYRTEAGEVQKVVFVFNPNTDSPRVAAKHNFEQLMYVEEPPRPVDSIDETNVSQ